jgi:hypothetical protein
VVYVRAGPEVIEAQRCQGEGRGGGAAVPHQQRDGAVPERAAAYGKGEARRVPVRRLRQGPARRGLPLLLAPVQGIYRYVRQIFLFAFLLVPIPIVQLYNFDLMTMPLIFLWLQLECMEWDLSVSFSVQSSKSQTESSDDNASSIRPAKRLRCFIVPP